MVLIHNNPIIKATEGMKKGGTIIVMANPDGLSNKEEKVVDDIIKKSMEGSENE